MTTLLGLDLTGRLVVVVGAGPVGVRRTRRFVEDGARVVLIDPDPPADARRMASHGDVELRQRPVRTDDLKGAWLVVAATSDPALNARLAARCEASRTWCVNASDGAAGSARVAAESRHGDLRIGVVSTGAADPVRIARIRDELIRGVQDGEVDLRRHRAGTGRVVLVGSGPGDPGLVTTAGREALRTADVVVTDRLGATGLLDQLPDDVEVVDVGKSPTNHPVPQHEINRIMVEHALAGRTVVRFKGGDPYLFGRGGEEVHACRAAGVAVEVVPGITSAFSVPALAGIPVTQRGVATSVLVASGHAGAEPAMLAAMAGGSTVVLLMAVTALPGICAAAVEHGIDPGLPVAVVERGSTGHERLTYATLASVSGALAARRVRAPAVVVIGRVAAQGFLDDEVCATPEPDDADAGA